MCFCNFDFFFKWHEFCFEACVRYFLFFHQMIALEKLWKVLFFSPKKLFSFSRYSDFCISLLSSVLPVSHYFNGWLEINHKIYDVMNCLNKNLITHFVWYLEKEERYGIETLSIDRALNKEHFYFWKIVQKC